MKLVPKTICGLTALMFGMIVGCETNSNPNSVMVQWAKNIRKLGIIPMFPPREDVQCGDVFIYDEDPESNATFDNIAAGNLDVGTSPRYTNLDLSDLVTKTYAKRESWPATPATFASTQATTQMFQQPTSGDSSVFAFPANTNRLKLVGFPEFMTTTYTQFDAGAAIPIEAINLGFGISGSSLKSVTIKVPIAEAYGVPTQEVLKAIRAVDGTITGLDLPTLSLQPADKDGNVYFRLLTEVYYARALDVMIETTNTGGGKVSVSMPKLAFVSPPTTQSGSTTTAPALQVITPQSAVSSAVATMVQNFNQAGALSVPGGYVQLVGYSDTSISLRRIWAEPVAIGFRGLTFVYNRQSRSVTYHGQAVGQLPAPLAPPRQ